MATYVELAGLFTNNDLQLKIEVAITIAAEAVRSEVDTTTNHANRLLWAKDAFRDPRGMRDQMLKAMLAQNKTASTATILAATDATIQTAVEAAIDIFADGS